MTVEDVAVLDVAVLDAAVLDAARLDVAVAVGSFRWLLMLSAIVFFFSSDSLELYDRILASLLKLQIKWSK